MPPSRRKGYEKERELVHLLEKKGWWASRLPASGKQAHFDVVAARKGRLILIEVKAKKEGALVRLPRWRWEESLRAAANAGAEAHLALRVPAGPQGAKWWLRPLDTPDYASQRSVVFHPPERAASRWVRLEEAIP